MKKLTLTLALFSIFLIFGSCQKKTPEPLRLGYLSGDLHQLPALVALEKDLFAKNGLKVKTAGIFSAGPEEMSAFRAGELDLGYVGIAPVVSSAANTGTEVKIVSLVNQEGSSLVISSSDNQTHSLADLAGQPIAIPGFSTVQDFLVRLAWENQKLQPDLMKTIVVKPPEMNETLRQGSIKAFIAWEPFPALALNSGKGKILVSSREIWPGHPCCVLIASGKAIQEHPGLEDALKKINREAIDFIRSNPDEAVKIAVKNTGMNENVIREAMARIIYSPDLNRGDLKKYVEFLSKMGYIKITDPEKFLDQILP
ncbi:MAG: ABC transporter substrate-binding protein [Proteobacteria bacterium]|nr:ABC transporter substrate-binding protein [Pseudomonadota bacterium]